MGVEIKSILVPTDFSETSDRALDWAIEIALPRKAEIHIIHVLEPIAYPVEWLEGFSGMEALEDVIAGNARKALEKLANKVRNTDLPVQTSLVFGYPPEAIISYVKEHNISMVCMGSHKRSGLEKLIIGSTTEKVVRQAPCPVLVIRNEN